MTKVNKHSIYLLFGIIFCILPKYTYSYWQQEVNYKINVKLDDKNYFLRGFCEIEYINNSTTELNEIYFHLWPNAYKNTKTAFARQKIADNSSFFQNAKDEERGYIDSIDFYIDNQKVQWSNDPENIDITKIFLNAPLLPGGKIIIKTPFRVKIPISFSRLGRAGQKTPKKSFEISSRGIRFNSDKEDLKHQLSSYQLTQWYPKPAVFDKYGWHPIPYLDQGEFYSEYGSFEVSITAPKYYVVAATGIMNSNPEEEKWLLDREKETRRRIRNGFMDKAFNKMSKDKDSIKSSDELKENLLFKEEFSNNNYKTLVFKQDKIHDFALFLDKDFHILTGEVVLPYSKRKVKTEVYFTYREAYLWKQALNYVDSSVYYYSLWNGEYPYDKCTAIEGALSAGAGMEYPMITVIGWSGNPRSLENVIAHEVGHNWFYGILGTNERRYGWMDEGINSYYDARYMKQTQKGVDEMFDSKRLKKIMKLMDINSKQISQEYLMETMYKLNASRNLDQEINLHADQYTQLNYGCIVYGKTALVLNYLAEYLGQSNFDKCMKKYFDTWKFKHPYPEDIKEVFEKETGKNLDWFFNSLIGTREKIDFSIQNVEKRNDKTLVYLKNNSDFPMPASITSLTSNSNEIETKWTEPFSGTTTVEFAENDSVERFMIDYKERIPEINRHNNTYKMNKLFPKIEPLRLQAFFSFDNPHKTQLFYSPVTGYNTTDGIFPGIAFYNSTIPVRRFQYWVMPMYSFKSDELKGSMYFKYNLLPKSGFQNISVGMHGSKFSNFQKLTPFLEFTVFPSHLRDSPVQKFILETNFITSHSSDLNLFNFMTESTRCDFRVLKFGYNIGHTNLLNDWNTELSFENINENWKPEGKVYTIIDDFPPYDDFPEPKKVNYQYNKISMITKYSIRYMKTKKIAFRLYTAIMASKINKKDRWSPDYLNIRGNDDRFFNENLIDRDHNFGREEYQLIMNEGGFKSKNFVRSDKFLVTLGTDIEIPKTPFSFFYDEGIVNVYRGNDINKIEYVGVGGIALKIIKNKFEVYYSFISTSRGYSPEELGINRLWVKFDITTNIYKLLDKVK